MEQGAILVEAVIVIPFFLIVWMGLVTLHHGWQARLEAQGRARDGAYRVSNQKDCGNLSVTADALGIGGEADGALAGVAQEALSLMDAVTGGTPFSTLRATGAGRGVIRLEASGPGGFSVAHEYAPGPTAVSRSLEAWVTPRPREAHSKHLSVMWLA